MLVAAVCMEKEVTMVAGMECNKDKGATWKVVWVFLPNRARNWHS